MDIDIEVVDDSRDAQRRGVIESARPQAVIAFNGNAAIASSARFQPDLLLLDKVMPGMNGFEIARYLQEDPKNRRAMLVALTDSGRARDLSTVSVDNPVELQTETDCRSTSPRSRCAGHQRIEYPTPLVPETKARL